jgi:hypothetical protein
MNRRDFLRSVTALVAVGALPKPLLAAVQASTQENFDGPQEFFWTDTEPSISEYRWSHSDRIVLGYSRFDGKAWEHVTASYEDYERKPDPETWRRVARSQVRQRELAARRR